MVRALDISSTVLYMPLVLLSFICVSFLAAPSVVADDNTIIDKVNVKVSASCTISGTGTNTHYAEIYNGTYEDDIGTTVLSAFCNDSEGFAIYAAGYTGGTIGGENSNKLVGTTQGTGNIATGTATSAGNPDVSNWAMKLAITQDSGDTTGTNAFAIDSDTEGPFSVYHTVPNNFTKVAHKNSLSNMNITTGGVKLTTTYAVYMSKTQFSGSYQGQVKYTLVHPSNAAPPTTIKTAMSAAGKTKLNGYYKIQDLDNAICGTVNIIGDNSITELIDVRDNHVYKVTKLEDGNCWFLDNLALDPTDSTTAASMSADNTNASAAAIQNYLNGGSTNAGWSNVAVMDVDSGFNSSTIPMINNASKDTLVTGYGSAATNGQSKVGIYYNYCAATAGTYCYDSGSGGDEPIYDLCPTNWKMPRGTDFDNLIYIVSGSSQIFDSATTTDFMDTMSLALSGVFDNSQVDGQNSSGSIYSQDIFGYRPVSLVYSEQYAFTNDAGTQAGYSIRCILAD